MITGFEGRECRIEVKAKEGLEGRGPIRSRRSTQTGEERSESIGDDDGFVRFYIHPEPTVMMPFEKENYGFSVNKANVTFFFQKPHQLTVIPSF